MKPHVAPLVSSGAGFAAPAHGPAVTQDEANAIVTRFELSRCDHIQVHWVQGFRGLQPLLHPIPKSADDWFS